ncbi:MAG: transglycosylase SLT domain-containing protein [Chitinivibrionales bacterium]|nr:transglycosylase SLT domain-containing protein [Chitinivibrionales bacterium]
MKYTSVYVAMTFCLLLSFFHPLSAQTTDLFPVPDILRENVEFWKKIYTEISLDEGYIHDNEYPLCIYKKITVQTQSERQRQKIIEDEKDAIRAQLSMIANEPEANWSESARQIATILQNSSMPAYARQTAGERLRFQQGQKDRFYQGLYRSGAYLDTIKAIFSRYNIPQRLIYLPHVESSFNADAYSKVGAAGLWQFMRSTGRLYLKIDYIVDQRRDGILSTYAAAKLLTHNYEQLQSWPLAITAYNHGLNGMMRAVENTGSRDIAVIIQRHESRSFKFASKNFYSCFLAASEIAMNPHNFFAQVRYAPPVNYRSMTLDYYMRPRTIASVMGISPQVLAQLNPAIRPIAFTQNRQLPKGIVIHLPAEVSSSAIEVAFDAIPDSLKSTAPERPNYYTVKRGDNIYSIARRFSLSASELARANNISTKNRLYAGKILTLPLSSAAIAEVVMVDTQSRQSTKPKLPIFPDTFTMAQVETKQQSQTETAPQQIQTPATQTPEVEKIVSPKPPFSQQQPSTAETTITAAQKLPSTTPTDTVLLSQKTSPLPQQKEKKESKISQSISNLLASMKKPKGEPRETTMQVAAKTSQDSVRDLFMDTADTLSDAPEMLTDDESTQFDATVYNLQTVYNPTKKEASIYVSIDETIGHYAEWLNVATQRIRQINGMGKNSEIRTNQRLLIPGDEAVIAQFSQKRLEYHLAIEEDFYAKYKVTEVKPYTIKTGESIWNLSQNESETPLWLLAKYNKHVNFAALQPKTQIWTLVIEEKSLQEILQNSNTRTPVNQRWQLSPFPLVPIENLR